MYIRVYMTTCKSFPTLNCNIKYNNVFGLEPTRAVVLPTIIFAHCRQIRGNKFKLIGGSKAICLKFVILSLLFLAYCTDTSGRSAVASDQYISQPQFFILLHFH